MYLNNMYNKLYKTYLIRLICYTIMTILLEVKYVIIIRWYYRKINCIHSPRHRCTRIAYPTRRVMIILNYNNNIIILLECIE